MKILIIAHGHADLSPGGAERAAYSLFQHLKTVPGVEPVLVARAEPRDIGHDGWFGAFRSRKDEFLWAPPPFDWFRSISAQPDVLREQIQTIAAEFKPDIVHFHHFIFYGLDAFSFFKAAHDCRVVLTLHEYALICRNDGQMVKTGSLRLCYSASPAECSTCFSDTSSGKFFLREFLSKDLLSAADMFVSPSTFLKDRYVAWGLPQDKFAVAENLLPPHFEDLATSDHITTRRDRIRFGYFGQLTRYKGANVLLSALNHLSPAALERAEIVIFGANLENQTQDFRDALEKQMTESAARVSFFGPYRNEDVRTLLGGVDWMVIPSIWWENSPLVIQEALSVGTPILASNIGGMAEKVRDGVDGLHFLAGSAMDCASKMEGIISGATLISVTPIDVRQQNKSSLRAHLQVYEPGELQTVHKRSA